MFHATTAIYRKTDTPMQLARKRSHRASDAALRLRLRTNPVLTKEEVRLGSFVESIEPQVRDAVRAFNRKGYVTWSSGFYGRTQAIDGPFTLPAEVARALRRIGCHVTRRMHFRMRYTIVWFIPDRPDLRHMRARWRRIADLLPDLGRPASHSQSLGAAAMRAAFRTDWRSSRRRRSAKHARRAARTLRDIRSTLTAQYVEQAQAMTTLGASRES
ncbi:MAG: hypothetical protein RLZZ324_1168 [Candidatus Parcubacteria bacterium]